MSIQHYGLLILSDTLRRETPCPSSTNKHLHWFDNWNMRSNIEIKLQDQSFREHFRIQQLVSYQWLRTKLAAGIGPKTSHKATSNPLLFPSKVAQHCSSSITRSHCCWDSIHKCSLWGPIILMDNVSSDSGPAAFACNNQSKSPTMDSLFHNFITRLMIL